VSRRIVVEVTATHNNPLQRPGIDKVLARAVIGSSCRR